MVVPAIFYAWMHVGKSSVREVCCDYEDDDFDHENDS
jgi:hypothetical protein